MRTRLTAGLAAVALAVALAGCWTQPGADAHRDASLIVSPGIDTSNVASLTSAWTHQLTASPANDPIVVPNRVYVTDGVTAYALDLGGGAEAWHQTVAVPPTQDPYSHISDVTLHGNQPLVPFNAFNGGGIHAYDVNGGSPLADVSGRPPPSGPRSSRSARRARCSPSRSRTRRAAP